MRSTALFMLLTLGLLMALALWHGSDTFHTGLTTSLHQLLRFLPILVIAMLIAGFTETLLPSDLVQTWLSDASGWRGITIAWLAGILTPGGSIIGLPIIAALHQAGVGLSVLMTYATSFALLSILRLPLEISFYGWRITTIRVLLSLGLPFIVGALTQLLLPLLKTS
ncbi:MAG TPA: permease [Anaerolineae bacterium]|nr:permease [Anaerolineae bacterium]